MGSPRRFELRTYAFRVRLDCEENRGLVPIQVVCSHFRRHPNAPAARKIFARCSHTLIVTQSNLTRGLATMTPEHSKSLQIGDYWGAFIARSSQSQSKRLSQTNVRKMHPYPPKTNQKGGATSEIRNDVPMHYESVRTVRRIKDWF